MKSCLRVLSQPTPSTAGEAELASDQQEREGSLELLADLCENMDNAAGTSSFPTNVLSLLPMSQAAQPLSLFLRTTPSAPSQLPYSPIHCCEEQAPFLITHSQPGGGFCWLLP
jgi:hypothetical protein